MVAYKLLKFEIQKCGQILCGHKIHFFMPGHILGNFLGSYIHGCCIVNFFMKQFSKMFLYQAVISSAKNLCS